MTPHYRAAALSPKADINVAPLVDIMLVMLVIFMVTVPLATAAIRLDTPPAIPSDHVMPDPIYIFIREDGSIHINETTTSIATLAADVCAFAGDAAARCAEMRVFIRGEPEVRHKAVMAVMDDLHAHGFYKIGLLNEDIK